jgi:porphobilinogen synthase
MTTFPQTRLRRLRRTPSLRRMFDLSMPGPEKFIWPVFVKPGVGCKEPIDAMPGQYRMSVDTLVAELESVVESGIGGILIFGLPDPDEKSADGRAAAREDGVVQRAICEVRKNYPGLVICTDVCLCAYTSHGHCGPLNDSGDVDNDATNPLLAEVAASHAAAGADIVAPSAMMDGQVAAIRAALDEHRLTDTLIMSYSTKFASAMYGPFRDAGESAPQHGDRQGYQASPGDPRTALRESEMDEAEGADLLMVKPAMFYLDILHDLRQQTKLPVAAYNVSGEYSMLIAAAERGWVDLRKSVRESMLAMTRAGADLIISYWANRYEEILKPALKAQ